MSDKEMKGFNTKLADDALEDVTGGTMILRTATYDKSENAGTHSAVLDDSMDRKVTLLGGATRSGNQNTAVGDIVEKKKLPGRSPLFGQTIQNA
ncbi:MAG: hypothetical protein IJT24_02035 [Lachnospiraceae bacterium]|nr:hypothetical protein [Lachnospiraceae bacterium]